MTTLTGAADVRPEHGKVSVTGHGDTVDNVNGSADSRNAQCQTCGALIAATESLFLTDRWRPSPYHGQLPPLAQCRECIVEMTPHGLYDHPYHLTASPWPPAHAEFYDLRNGAPRGFCWCGRYMASPGHWQYEHFGPGVTDGLAYSRCQGCGRHLGRTAGWPRRCCSPACARDVSNRRRRVQRQEAACDGCGGTFVPPRGDAQYCSGACRQRAYRRRLANGWQS